MTDEAHPIARLVNALRFEALRVRIGAKDANVDRFTELLAEAQQILRDGPQDTDLEAVVREAETIRPPRP